MKYIFLSVGTLLSCLVAVQLATASSLCTAPIESDTGKAIFEYVRDRLHIDPLNNTDSTGWNADTAGSGRGKYQATFSDPEQADSCYAIFAVQDYETQENSLCRINEELTDPTVYPFEVVLTTGSPYASAGYSYAEGSGAFVSIISWLDQYQVGTLVYCGEDKLDNFHAKAVSLAKEAIAKGVGTASTFTDTADYDFKEAIDYIARQRIVAGYEDGSYQPDREINRAEFTKIVIGARASQDELAAPETDCFTDVSSDAWFAPFVCTAKEQEIVGGYPDGSYAPGSPVSVAEGLKIIVEAFAVDQLRAAADGEAWYQRYVDHAKVAGIYLTDFTSLTQPLTRGQMAELMYRLRTQTRSSAGMDFLLLTPRVDAGKVTVSELPVHVSGYAPAGSTVTVNGGYALKSCCTEVTNGLGLWEYNLKAEYGNIGTGTNNYTFTAKDTAGNILGENKLRVIYPK